MKIRRCPNKHACWGYETNDCQDCVIGNLIKKQKIIIQRKKSKIARLTAEVAELRARLKRATKFAECCPADDCAGDWSVGIPACPLWDFDDVDESGNQIEGGCVLKKWLAELQGGER